MPYKQLSPGAKQVLIHSLVAKKNRLEKTSLKNIQNSKEFKKLKNKLGNDAPFIKKLLLNSATYANLCVIHDKLLTNFKVPLTDDETFVLIDLVEEVKKRNSTYSTTFDQFITKIKLAIQGH